MDSEDKTLAIINTKKGLTISIGWNLGKKVFLTTFSIL